STGDVDAHEVDDDKRQAGGEAGETGRRERMRNAENADKEQESAHDLEDEGRDDVVLAEVARPPAVLPESARPALRFAGQDEIEHGRSDDRAKDLCDPVADHLGSGHTAGDEDPKADRRIDMAARDRPDAVGHSDDRKAKGARDAEQVHSCWARAHTADDRRPAAEEHQSEGSYEFRQLLVHCFYPLSLITTRPKLSHRWPSQLGDLRSAFDCVGSQFKRPCSICVATAAQKSNRLRERARRAFSCSSRAILHAVASPCRARNNATAADTLMRRDIDSTSINAHPLGVWAAASAPRRPSLHDASLARRLRSASSSKDSVVVLLCVREHVHRRRRRRSY